MSPGGASRAPSLRAWAHEVRSQSAALSDAAVAQQRRTDELCERLAEALILFDGPPLGDRGERFLLRLGRLRPLVRLARHDVRRWLERVGLSPDVIHEVTLACSEACANAIEHPRDAGRQLVEIEAHRADGHLELRVRDFGRWMDRAPSEVRGRGLSMIRRLVDSLEVQQGGDGTVVVMRRALDAPQRLDPDAGGVPSDASATPP